MCSSICAGGDVAERNSFEALSLAVTNAEGENVLSLSGVLV